MTMFNFEITGEIGKLHFGNKKETIVNTLKKRDLHKLYCTF